MVREFRSWAGENVPEPPPISIKREPKVIRHQPKQLYIRMLLPQWHPANQTWHNVSLKRTQAENQESTGTSSTSVGVARSFPYLSSNTRRVPSPCLAGFPFLCAFACAARFCSVILSNSSPFTGQFHWFALNLARRSSKDSACLKVHTTLLEAANGRRRGIKPTEATESLYRGEKRWIHFEKGRHISNWPNSQKFDIDVDREGFLEHVGLFPSYLIRSGVHFIGEWNLLVIARREKANFVNHAS